MNTINFRPLGDRVLVRRRDETEQVRDGVIIPDRARDKQQEATVVAVGPGLRTDEGTLQPLEVSVGDTVLISQFGGDDVTLDATAYTLVREDDILGILLEAEVAAIH